MKTPIQTKPIYEVFLSSKQNKDFVLRSLKKGSIRKLGSKLYTTNILDPLEEIVSRNVWLILSLLVPGALISDRTAIESKPSNGSLYIISSRKRNIVLPGLIIKTKRGEPSLPTDRSFINGLFLPSPGRAFLENCKISKSSKKNGERRTLAPIQIEEELEKILQLSGEEALNKIRDDAKAIYEKLKLIKEYKILDGIIGTLLSSNDIKLTSKLAKARKSGVPYDIKRVELFEKLRQDLEKYYPKERRKSKNDKFLPFFEAYFSNFIEGTEFEVAEASEIVFEGKIPRERPLDAHDILGTYRVVSNLEQMSRDSKDSSSFINSIKGCHMQIMSQRQDKNPGNFKTVNNRAGLTTFVAPELVQGTLIQGYNINATLSSAFNRAVFKMFFISEIHPFLDGNGRTARVFMNMELHKAEEQKIIIPTILRGEYLGALKALSHSQDSEPIIKVFDFAQRFVGSIDWSNLEGAEKNLRDSNAFMDSALAEREGIRLKIIGI